jgi:hypothetical protein
MPDVHRGLIGNGENDQELNHILVNDINNMLDQLRPRYEAVKHRFDELNRLIKDGRATGRQRAEYEGLLISMALHSP